MCYKTIGLLLCSPPGGVINPTAGSPPRTACGEGVEVDQHAAEEEEDDVGQRPAAGRKKRNGAID